ncbi:family 16 glycosylhydrolase [Halarsenatibacter silvermanii]|uniref:Beta-glucanase n=1 Tax=Halarsenatibacter silvermanii TaxID=321763 RepID=A0A1G9M6I7_9FIRM|nr:family 16 glycosylhydrolase [Halarsenatibacter silvermanii]SDL69305.1 Glycosyl hydrolases family 16 [Halarsenatibacter silvermanii]
MHYIGDKFLNTMLLILFLFVSLLFLFSGGGIVSAETVEVTGHHISRESLLERGELTAEIDIENLTEDDREIWLGYSLFDPRGEWHDIEPGKIKIRANSGKTVEIAEEIFPGAEILAGEYLFVAAAWDEHPEDGGIRLSDMRKREKITAEDGDRVRERDKGEDEDLGLKFSGHEFLKAGHRLGRGWLNPENVKLENQRLKISSPADSLQGGEVRTEDYFSYGSYSVKLKSDYAPGSFSAFFLYEDVDYKNDEIDIEIYNDGSRQIDFVTFVEGEKTNHEKAELPFDPASDFHEYRIVYLPDRINFYVEDELMASFDSDLPDDEMRIMANHWWPNWLEAERKQPASEIYIKQLDFQELRER